MSDGIGCRDREVASAMLFNGELPSKCSCRFGFDPETLPIVLVVLAVLRGGVDAGGSRWFCAKYAAWAGPGEP